MKPDIARARQSWIKTEMVLALISVAGLVISLILLWPPPLPESPESLLAREIDVEICPDVVGTRQLDVAAELAKPNPEFTDAFLVGEDLSGYTFSGTSFRNANLNGANLAGTVFDQSDLTCAHLAAVTGNEGTQFLITKLEGAFLSGAKLPNASFTLSNLTAADLTGARLKEADFSHTNLTSAVFGGTEIKDAILRQADLALADYRPIDAPEVGAAETARGFARIRLGQPDMAGLNRLANGFSAAGLKYKASEVRATAARWERYHILNGSPEPTLSKRWGTRAKAFFFGWISADGSQQMRPLFFLTLSTLVFALLYWVALLRAKAEPCLTYRISAGGVVDETCPLPASGLGKLPAVVLFSISNALLIAIPSFNLLDFAGRVIDLSAPYKVRPPLGWLSTVQSLLTGVFLIHWIVV